MTIIVTVPTMSEAHPTEEVETDADTMNTNSDGSLVLMKNTKRLALYAKGEWIKAEDPSV